ncbi:TraR/DksA C4-type zinc finger protein [Patescibacteria group bacterium]|nr:TraR/DksA C4-type zinc finger protein [Patescibacteria group bacterium]MBU2579710.1 TraR/DksA C4-type zinc finger protein [Patescibacteria group bacterium]MBU4030892.1 TraR/DksA C4-type zinc finger protein [Patescibacteria group bacterium]MBU4082379.1 TraR/DksA C4-type zinc finger protein [Patescibacteria group bacterium]MCG2808809.1 TraR/DksA C4-type zinc finger protein [Candidatus Portnoybacteria bacterium]
MDKKTLEQFNKKLEAEKNKLTKELKTFARKDPKIKGNWLTRFPFFNANRSRPDERAEEREDYENLLPVEYALETRLKDIDEALERIKKGTYGNCANCGKEIRIKRLEIVPEAKLCSVCGRR